MYRTNYDVGVFSKAFDKYKIKEEHRHCNLFRYSKLFTLTIKIFNIFYNNILFI